MIARGEGSWGAGKKGKRVKVQISVGGSQANILGDFAADGSREVRW